MSFDLTWVGVINMIPAKNALVDITVVSFLPNKVANVFLFVQAIKEKAGADRAFLLSLLHEGDIAPGIFAAGLHAVLVSIQFRRRNKRRSVFHRSVGIEHKVIPTFLELGQAFLTNQLTSGGYNK